MTITEIFRAVEEFIGDYKVVTQLQIIKGLSREILVKDIEMALKELEEGIRITIIKIEIPGPIRPIELKLYAVKGTKITF